jgi:hypothetical protein
MYLIFKNEKEAKERNLIEGFRRGLGDKHTTRYWWAVVYQYEDGRVVLNVGDGKGLSEDEMKDMVEKFEVEEVKIVFGGINSN